MTDMPERIARLPRRGAFPVPPIFGVDENGVPDFTVLNPEKWVELVRLRQCHICGESLDATMSFIGGPISIENHMFQDGPMHHECATYSLQACPFLAQGKSYTERPARVEGRGDHRPLTGNPERFGRLETEGFAPVRLGDTIILNAAPATTVEWWTGGERE